MPYFLHAQSDPPDTGTPFTDKSQAIAARQTGQTITYLANDAERETWTQREQRRLLDKTYTPLPWLDDDGFPQKRYRVLANGTRGFGDETPFGNHTGQLATYYAISRYHFAHVSLRSDAMIAYTPSDEHGLANRQLRIRCGKYLDLVAPWLLPIEKDKLCARVRSMASATFKLATTPSEIRAVYRYGQGFSSCMDGRNFTADDDTNPVSAYGNSDLAVAYLGDLDSDDPRVTARVVVWPERKLYTRIYGDELLACLLKQDNWQATDWEDDDPLTGAKIRAIRYNGSSKRYVMPYLDFARTVSLSGQYFVICDRDDPGEFTCREINGRTGSSEIECDHCGRNFTPSEDGESDCPRCRENMWMCDHCDESFYSDDNSTDVSTFGYRTHLYCERCATQLAHTCDWCNESFYDCQFSTAQHTTRRHDDLTAYCRSCAEEVVDERAAQEEETDLASDVVPIRATNDTYTLPLPLTSSVYDDRPWRDIPIGSTVQVIEIPHHTGTKENATTMLWAPCGSPGHALCYCTSPVRSWLATAPIPMDKVYRILASPEVVSL